MEKDFNIDRAGIPLELFKHLGDGNKRSVKSQIIFK